MQRKANAEWNGHLKDGKGQIGVESGTFTGAQYSFGTRFENGAPGTNPEELLAAAHAGCFSMALANELGKADMTPESVKTEATVTIDKDESGFSITKVHLAVKARVPGADEAKFRDVAEGAKKGCPVSKLFKAEITMDAQLDNAGRAAA